MALGYTLVYDEGYCGRCAAEKEELIAEIIVLEEPINQLTKACE